jgi:phosphoglycolate phosphatase-like HAD superfamily hydrolase
MQPHSEAHDVRLPSWRDTPARGAILAFIDAVTDRGSPEYVAEVDRVAVFDNDGTLWTEQPVYAQLMFALDRAAELGHPTTLEALHAGGMSSLIELITLTHAGITTDEFTVVAQKWLTTAQHPKFGRPYPSMIYEPMLELLGLLHFSGFSCWIFSGGGTDFMRTWAPDAYGLAAHRIIGSVGETEFRTGPDGPVLMKAASAPSINDGPQKPSAIHRHIGQRPILAAGNTDGDLAMLEWTAASPHRTLQLIVHHTDGEREYAYDRDPILGSGTDQVLAAAREHDWTVIDMAADWSVVHAPGARSTAPPPVQPILETS